jgi:protein phosphatase 1L
MVAYIDIAYYGGYILILLMFWAILRFIANSLLNLIKNYGDSTNTVVPFSNGVAYPVSYWSERGGRPYQEDRHQQLKGKGTDDSSLYGVFDGHGGAKASQFCKDFLLQTVVKDPDFPKDVAKALSRTFFKIDADFSAKARIQMLTDGTTATVAAIHDRTVYVANAGDSRAIIIRKGGKVKVMSIDHRPDRKDEELRIRYLLLHSYLDRNEQA